MARIRVQEAASFRLDEISRYTKRRWGKRQADHYLTGLFAAFDQIDSHGVTSKPVPAEFEVAGYYFRYERHFVFWRRSLSARATRALTDGGGDRGVLPERPAFRIG